MKRFDNIFAAVMLVFGVAVVLAGFWCLLHSISRAEEMGPVIIVRYVPDVEVEILEVEP